MTAENENIIASESLTHLPLDLCTKATQPHLQTLKASLGNPSGAFAFITFGADHTREIGKEDKSLWVFYSTLKHTFGRRSNITQTYLKLACGVNLPYKYETARKFMTKLVSKGFAFKYSKGYLLRSIDKVAKEFYGVEDKGYTYVKGETKKEVLARVYYCAFYNNVKQQQHNQSDKKLSKSISHRMNTTAYKSGLLTVGVRWVSELAKCTSATVGSRIEKEWERLGLVRITRGTSLVCTTKQLRPYLNSHPEDRSRLFISGNEVFRRELNKIVCLV